jgi:putative peptidoglycan lipid II flippase
MRRKFLPAAIGLGTLQINTFLDTLLAMWPLWVGATVLGVAYPMDERSNVLLSGAQRLYQFPLGVFGIAVATAVFPMLSRHADEPLHFVQTLRRGLRLSLFIGLPASAGLFLVAREAVAVPYSGGSVGWSNDGVARGGAVLAGFALAVWAYSLNHVFTRAFYAKGDTRTPMKVAIAMVGLNLVLNLALIWRFREAGMAWATTASATAQCLVLGTLSARFAPAGDRLIDRVTLVAIARIVVATAAMAAGVLALRSVLPMPTLWRDNVVRLGACGGVGIVVYLLAAAALRCHELGWLIRRRA